MKSLYIAFLVEVSAKDIPSRVDKLDREQQELKTSISALKQEEGMPKLKSTVDALSSQVWACTCIDHDGMTVDVLLSKLLLHMATSLTD